MSKADDILFLKPKEIFNCILPYNRNSSADGFEVYRGDNDVVIKNDIGNLELLKDKYLPQIKGEKWFDEQFAVNEIIKELIILLNRILNNQYSLTDLAYGYAMGCFLQDRLARYRNYINDE